MADEDPYFERLELCYCGRLIYEGYGDDLVTLSDAAEEIQLKLNLGSSRCYHVVTAKKFGSIIIWVPDIGEKQANLWCQEQDFRHLWETLRYPFARAYLRIRDAVTLDVLAFWFSESGVKGTVAELNQWGRDIKNTIVAFSTDSREDIQALTMLLTPSKSSGLLLEEASTATEHIIAYLDDGTEWEIAAVDSDNNLRLRLTDGLYARVI